MRIFECCPFYNENMLADVKIKEASNWIDELHITESNKTFTYNDKSYNFSHENNKNVFYHKIDGAKYFKKPKWGITREPWFLKYKKYQWHNEKVQRNASCSFVEVCDDDVVILTDLDEMVDSRYADQIINEVKKHGIIALKLHYTEFYFNLFVDWSKAPIHHWCYRSYAMTGKYFKSMTTTSHDLRMLGTSGEIVNKIHCIEPYVGFHHSWIGDEEYIVNKLKSYAHDEKDHDSNVFVTGGEVNRDYIKKCLTKQLSLYGKSHKLFVDNNIEMLKSVIDMREKYADLFL